MVPPGQLHALDAQVAPLGHGMAQPLQLLLSFVKLTHEFEPVHRLGNEVLLQVATQLDPEHVVDPLAGAVGQAAQVPGAAPQVIVPVGQLHAPGEPEQLPPVGQCVPQPPQLVGSFVKLTHVFGVPVHKFGYDELLQDVPQAGGVPVHVAVPFVGAGQAMQLVVPQ
jgi:hypothetical protein